jgi:hypothetical protein
MDQNENAAMNMTMCSSESFVPSYVEHLDPLGDTVEVGRRKQHLMDKIRSDGRVQNKKKFNIELLLSIPLFR